MAAADASGLLSAGTKVLSKVLEQGSHLRQNTSRKTSVGMCGRRQDSMKTEAPLQMVPGVLRGVQMPDLAFGIMKSGAL